MLKINKQTITAKNIYISYITYLIAWWRHNWHVASHVNLTLVYMPKLTILSL